MEHLIFRYIHVKFQMCTTNFYDFMIKDLKNCQ